MNLTELPALFRGCKPIAYVAVGLLSLVAVAPMCFGQETEVDNELEQEHREVVQLNERLRTEVTNLNADIDTLRAAQRWTLLLVAIGVFCLGFVLGYAGRRSKDAAKSS